MPVAMSATTLCVPISLQNKSLLMKKLKLIRKNYRNAEIIRYRTVTSYK